MDVEATLKELHEAMLTEYRVVAPATNPVHRALPTLSPGQLRDILTQYAIFSRKIVSFLLDAFYVVRFSDWASVVEEIRTNISEELGTGQSDVPHYTRLRRGFLNGLGHDIARVPVGLATGRFVTQMHQLLATPDPAYVTGAVYALETTATPELELTYGWTRQLFARHGKDVVDDVRLFFETHISKWEVLHEERLREALALHLNDENVDSFSAGFRSVLKIMETWWAELLGETKGSAHEGSAACA